MAVWKSIGSIYLLTWIIHWTSFWLVKRHATGYFRAHVMHLEHIIRNELLMVLGSFFIWRRLTSLMFETVGPKQKGGDEDDEIRGRRPHRHVSVPASSAKSKHIRLVVYSILALFLVSVHLSLFVNYFANAVEPRWISMISLANFGV